MTKYDYQSDWCSYTYPENDGFYTDSDITERFSECDLSKSRLSASGIPIYRDGHFLYVNNETENTLIFGETGSKKTRTLIAPLIALTAGAGESAFITDVKGELSSNSKLQNYLKAKKVNTVYLDFRNFAGDGFNILEAAYRTYLEDENRGMAMARRFVSSLVEKFKGTSADPFWADSALLYLIPVVNLMFRACRKSNNSKAVNMFSISRFASMSDAGRLNRTISDLPPACREDSMINMLKTVTENPDKTLACIMGTVQGILEEFILQKDLMNMLAQSTFDVESMYSRPTFVFLIIPDEVSTYDSIAGMLIDVFYRTLIETFSKKYQNSTDPRCRINFICDEFCNLKINDMKAKISASRSRFMRWYLCCQSKAQLETSYGDAASTIIGNCQNTVFLQSSDSNMLSYISDLCGTTIISDSGNPEPLVTVEMLKKLRKEREYKEALIFRGDMRYLARLTDIDSYDFLKPYGAQGAFKFRNKCPLDVAAFTSEMMCEFLEDEFSRHHRRRYNRLPVPEEAEPEEDDEDFLDDDFLDDVFLDDDFPDDSES